MNTNNRYSAVLCAFLLLLTIVTTSHGDGQQKVLSVDPNKSSGSYKSPDGKYTFKYSAGDGALSDIAILYRNGDKNKSNLLKIKNLRGVRGFTWLPKREHTLVLAVQRTEGKPFIAMWNGRKMKVLKVGNLPQDVDPAAEYFSIVGVSLDGKKVIYTHFDATSRSKENIVDKTMKLRHGLVLWQPCP